MRVAAIDYTTGVVTYQQGGFLFPVQEDWDIIPTLKVGDLL